MKNLLNFKSIRSRIMFGFSIVTILIIALGLYLLGIFNTINNNTEQIKDENLPRLIATEKITISLSNMVAASRAYVLSGDQLNRNVFDEYAELSSQNVQIINAFDSSDEFTELIANTKEWQDFIEEEVFKLYDAGNTDLAYQNVLKADSFVPSLMDKYEQRAADQENEIISLENEVFEYGKTTIYIVIGVIILVVVLSTVSGFITANSISRPIRNVRNRMDLIAGGDLSSEPLETKSRDEVSQLINATNTMTATNRELLTQINTVSETVSSQSEELTQSANEVMAGTEQIAITMEELATGSELQANNASDLSSTMSSFAEKVDEASIDGGHIKRSSTQVIEMTNAGSELMGASTKQMSTIDQIVQDAVHKVEGLDKHSQKISELVLVIQGIAEQTNLLALNAAIEAARAGEQGKGFAVVADEVRKLAEQSSASVTNITDIVNQIQLESSSVVASLQEGYKEVEEGTSQIVTTSETFEQISAAVSDMGERINHVSDNLTEIALNSITMGRSVEEIAAISEESAAGVEETSASSQQANSAMEEVSNSSSDLAKLAEELNGLVQRFTL